MAMFTPEALGACAGIRVVPGPQMPSGTVGKSGYLKLGFERRDTKTILADLDRARAAPRGGA